MPDKRLYAIDTSALLAIDDNGTEALSRLIELVREGRVRTVSFAIDEFNRHASPFGVSQLRSVKALVEYRDWGGLVPDAKRIINLYPTMSRPTSARTVADPWVIALAKIEQMTVVSRENNEADRKIPDVCRREKIRHLTLDDFTKLELR